MEKLKTFKEQNLRKFIKKQRQNQIMSEEDFLELITVPDRNKTYFKGTTFDQAEPEREVGGILPDMPGVWIGGDAGYNPAAAFDDQTIYRGKEM